MVFLFTSNFGRTIMFRRYFLFLLPVITGIFLWSCTSPTDVAANRKIIHNVPISLQFEPEFIDMGLIMEIETGLRESSFEVTIRNTSATQSMNITSFGLKHGDRGFLIPFVYSPGQLNPMKPHTSFGIPVFFRARGAGEYIDTLVVNGDPSLSYPLRIVLSPATIEMTDVNFGALNIGQTKTMICTVFNRSDAIATIMDLQLHGPDATIFTLTSISLPVTINPGESINVSVTASPSTLNPAMAILSVNASYDAGSVYTSASLIVNE
jgi:hypothetical protein